MVPWREALLSVAITLASCQPAPAASCQDEIDRVSQQLGLSPGSSPSGAAEPPATTESRGLPPEVTSRLSNTGIGPGNPTAMRRTEVLASLQAARAAAAQGDESECLAQLAKAQSALQAQ